MALTPEDVEKKTFATALRGYDLDEVDDFLDEVVAAMREMQERVASLEQAPKQSPRGDIDESAVGRALIAAQATADRIIADAREEAERILSEARDEAQEWQEERAAKKADVEAEMNELSRAVAEVRNRLAVLATAVADKLDEMDEAISSVPVDVARSFEEGDGDTEVGDAEVVEFSLEDDEEEPETGDASPLDGG